MKSREKQRLSDRDKSGRQEREKDGNMRRKVKRKRGMEQ